MIYDVVIGQTETKARLKNLISENRVPHALLFTGGEGCGLLPSALAFAQHLYCPRKTPGGPCGTCASCNKVAKLIHPDLHFIFPAKSSHEAVELPELMNEFRAEYSENPYISLKDWSRVLQTESTPPIIGVRIANEIIRRLSYTSYEGSYKVMIIWEADRMNAEAANKLLKILEEPPDETIFILTTSAPDQLLSTIISRVQQIQFYAATEEEVASALRERSGLEPELARQAALLSDGYFGEALRIAAENQEGVSMLPAFQNFMRIALKFDGNKAAEWLNEYSSLGREWQKQFLRYSLAVFRDCLMLNYGSENLVRMGGEELGFLKKFSPFITGNNYDRIVEDFNTACYHIERNASGYILFMDLFFRTAEQLRSR